jgi:hypothetical protein
MAENRITVERTINAPTAEIFEVLSSPERHVEIDGSGFIRSDEKSDRIQQAGDVFTMHMEGSTGRRTTSSGTTRTGCSPGAPRLLVRNLPAGSGRGSCSPRARTRPACG